MRVALLWWLWVLSRDICEEHPWEVPTDALAHLLVDARGEPSRCAAVLFIDGRCLYTDGPPSQSIKERLAKRSDSQIMALESLAIGLGLSTFASELQVALACAHTLIEPCHLCL